MVGLPLKSKWSKADKRQDRSKNKIERPKECQRTQILPGFDTTFVKNYKQLIQEDRQNEKIVEERNSFGVDTQNR